ncbi:NAD(P)(+) transhydrogenase (Re/Si-specific) subunit beta, partial [Bacteroides heparinolyticus]|uniref:NAD(P)(+) transhydrogenase (Re/Si-specific) subunit beta n=1 Tax=Prevotella heparinolytica TaxID=28113 RepID=UPI0035A0A11A
MDVIQIVISVILSVAVLVGISMMSKVKTSVNGNLLSALALFLGVVATLYYSKVIEAWTIYPAVLVGALIGGTMARKAQMIEMPQIVALFNGLGGGASALVGIMSASGLGFSPEQIAMIVEKGYLPFVMFTSMLAIAVGMITLIGSLVAAGKLHRVLPQKPMVWFSHSLVTSLMAILTLLFIVLGTIDEGAQNITLYIIGCTIFSSLFGLYFSVRVGGADMPITISLLNSLSGVAGSIAGMAISDIFLVAVGGIVGASGLLLTQIMCRAMNRSLVSILFGGAAKPQPQKVVQAASSKEHKIEEVKKDVAETPASVLSSAKEVIIVPGYGMALAQAQHLVKQLAETLEGRGARVRFAIHPVAGRMPGHMNVLLAEADVSYEKLFEMDAINDDFREADAVVVIGANDVLNPAARDAEGTPIYGMPVLNVDAARNVIICNYDLKPGYAGVDNPLYTREEGVFLQLGDAKKTLQDIISGLNVASSAASAPASAASAATPASVLSSAKEVIIVPGYGMALAQAQHLVKQLAETLEGRGARVRFAIHPVAGRMP